MTSKGFVKQIVGNMGLHYIAYELSRRGWNVSITSRNAVGVDIVIYNEDATDTRTIQVKSLSSRNNVTVNNLDLPDFFIIFRKSKPLDDEKSKPEIFIIPKRNVVSENYVSRSKWYRFKEYEKYPADWNLIGNGFK